MFGHNDGSTAKENSDEGDLSTISSAEPTHHESSQADASQPAVVYTVTSHSPASHSASDSDTWQHPGAPLDGKATPADDTSSSSSLANHHVVGTDDGDDHITHELIDIKQKALGQLSPLLSTLDQSPEDKFRTLMMMIQASDDQSLVKSAYEAAHDIEDEKARAQALLDIVNEINYFTTQHQA